MRTNTAVLLKHICSTLTKPVLCCLIIMQLGAGFVVAADFDDSDLFVEAFTAYQKQDYLSAIERVGVINHLFPDSPLRDVALLLLARSGLRSGDNELAAKAIHQFNTEFANNPLKSTVEEELQRLANRLQLGGKLLPTGSLNSAALKVRTEQIALERSATEKPGQRGIAAAKTTVELNDLDRQGPKISARKTVRAVINMPLEVKAIAVGQRGVIPFEVAVLDGPNESFMLEVNAPQEFDAFLYVEGLADLSSSSIRIGEAASVKGSIILHMPPDRVDGHKTVVTLRAVSVESRHPVQTRETLVITSAPLVRIVAKPEKPALAPGEHSRYRVTVLNVGSLPARNISVRVLLPIEVEFVGGVAYRQDAAEGVVLDIDTLDTGKLADFALDVKVREDCPVGQELRSRVEVINTRLKTKEIFTSTAAVVQNARPKLP